MKLSKIEKVALKSIFKNRTRSLLTSLGIIIGVCSVIVMVAIGEGSQKKIEKDISSMGTNLIMIRPGAMNFQGVRGDLVAGNPLHYKDCEIIKKNAILIDCISPSVTTNAQIVSGSGNWNCRIEGVDPTFLQIRNYQIGQGTMFTDNDVKSRKKGAVLGYTVAEELFPNTDAIGRRIRINNTPFTVIGVLDEKGENSMGMDQDDLVLAPSTTVIYRLKGGKYGSYVNTIFVSAKSEKMIDETINELETILMRAHDIDNEDDADFSIHSQS